MYYASFLCTWIKRLVQFIDQSSSEGAIELTGTMNGLTGTMNGLTGTKNGLAGTENGLAGTENGLTGTKNGLTGTKYSLTGTRNGLTIRIRAKYRPRNAAALHDKQRRFGSRKNCALICTEFCSMLPV